MQNVSKKEKSQTKLVSANVYFQVKFLLPLPSLLLILTNALDSRKVSIMVLLDMSKAFDSIRYDILLSKLQNLDFSQGALDWFQSYLSNRQQCVRIGDAVSKVLPLEFGVPQGSILDPVLFTFYVNDLLSVPKRCLSASHVDDCKLYLSFSPAELTRLSLP